MNHRSPWSLEMEDILITLIKNNINLDEICSIMGRTENSIKSRLKSIAIKMIKNKEPIENICVSTKLTIDEISYIYAQYLSTSKIKVETKVRKNNIDKNNINNTSWLNKIREKISGKKVLIIDLETTGLAIDKNKYHQYYVNDNFDTCRIVEIGYYYSDNFDYNTREIQIHNYLRKPTDFFSIPEEAVNIHGITYEQIINNGYTLGKILTANLYNVLNKIDIFISHNTNFDFNVLLNELYRLKQFKTIKRLLQMQKDKNVICTCRSSGYKKLTSIYENIFGSEVNVAHRAGDDVKTLIEIILNKQFDCSEYKTKFITNIENNTINVNDSLIL